MFGFALRLTEQNKAEVTEKEEMETMKNMLMSVLALGVTIGLIGAGTYAYFSDVETANNLFSAGTLDLQLSEDGITYYNDPVDPLIVCVNMAPGDETDPATLYFKNVGTMDGIVTVDVSYVEYDDPLDGNAAYEYAAVAYGTDVDADTFAKHLWVTHASLDVGPNIVYYWALQVVDYAYGSDWDAAIAAFAVYDPDGTAGNGDELPTAYGLSKITLYFWDGYEGTNETFSPDEVHYETLQVQLDPSVGNEYQFDGINLSIVATIIQVPET
jgi:spore coat-associated protein N